MRSVTERNPLIIGAVVIALIVVGTGASLFLNAGVLKDRFTLLARFPDTAGLEPGDPVRVAGITVGQVDGVELAGTAVVARLEVDAGVELSADTTAAVVVETLLGQKYVRLTTGDEWSRTLDDGDVIENGRTPTEVLDLQNVGTKLLEEIDAAAFDGVLDRLAAVTEGKRDQVVRIVDGLNRLTGEVNRRKAEVGRLLDSAATLSSTLAERDDELVAAIDQLGVVVDGLADRRAELAALLRETRAAAGATADLVGTNRARLDRVFHDLDASLQIVGRHQIDLAHAVAYLASAVEGFASVGRSAGGFENRWANIFTEIVGRPTTDPVLGSCGAVDLALDAVLGPDPLPCDRRDGPTASGATAGARAGLQVEGSDATARSLTLLLAPLLGAGR